ncbi:hypothetical protein HDU98_011017 [Podochytrium sp. JEL0797]|nr:hypothetical protein HDU98_011017 [Podochytrium sp. JEL0797]
MHCTHYTPYVPLPHNAKYFGARRFLRRLSGIKDAEFLPGQFPPIEAILNNHDVLVKRATGGGKTAIALSPSLFLKGLTIFVGPLSSLSREQCEKLRKADQVAYFLHGDLNHAEIKAIFENFKENAGKNGKVLFISPEKFCSLELELNLKHYELLVEAVVLDEAHLVEEWGNSFRSAYLRAVSVIKRERLHTEAANGKLRVILLTATATPQVTNFLTTMFEISPQNVFTSTMYRDELDLRFVRTTHEGRLHQLKSLIEEQLAPGSKYLGDVVVYCLFRSDCEVAAKYINDHLRDKLQFAVAYHAALTTEERIAIETNFAKPFQSGDKPKVVFATVAFGLGVDKQDIRRILHFRRPTSAARYYQEIGRGSRDHDAPAECVVIWVDSDEELVSSIVLSDQAPERDISSLVWWILRPGTLPPTAVDAEDKFLIQWVLCQLSFRRLVVLGGLNASLGHAKYTLSATLPNEAGIDLVARDICRIYAKLFEQKLDDASFMASLFNLPGCVWVQLLQRFGEECEECGTCSTCLNGAFRPPLVQQIEITHREYTRALSFILDKKYAAIFGIRGGKESGIQYLYGRESVRRKFETWIARQKPKSGVKRAKVNNFQLCSDARALFGVFQGKLYEGTRLGTRMVYNDLMVLFESTNLKSARFQVHF